MSTHRGAPGKRGRPPKLGETQAITLRLPVELHRAMRHYTIEARKSMNELITEVLQDWWSSQPGRVAYERLAQPRRGR